MDPNQLFVISAITRGGIVENFNDLFGTDLDPTDQRFTDELCKAYANGLGNASDNGHDIEEFHEAFFNEYFSK